MAIDSDTYTGHFLVVDSLPADWLVENSGGLNLHGQTATLNVLGEAEYNSITYITDGADVPHRGTIDGQEVLSTGYIEGATFGSPYSFTINANNGGSVDSQNNNEDTWERGQMVFYELADGRLLISLGDSVTSQSLHDEINAVSAGSGISSIDLNGVHVVVVGDSSPLNPSYLYTQTTFTAPYTGGAPCFTSGTLIETDQGPVAVETLKTGDRVRTKDHGFQPVKWVGESRVFASGFDVPLRIKAGTFGNTRDLVVSKRHKMLMDHTHLSLMFDVEEAFACAMHLRNDTAITREPEGWVTYYHILLPQHEVIFAEGAATESFYPDEGTLESMAAKTKADLLETFDPETYGPQARLTFDPIRAMWIGRNLDILQGDDMGQIAAYENAMKAAE